MTAMIRPGLLCYLVGLRDVPPKYHSPACAARSISEPLRELLGVQPSTTPYVVPGDI
jgi:hypothetical protein